LHTVFRGHGDNDRFGGTDSLVHSPDKVKLTRGVDNIDFGVLPLGVSERSVQRDFSLDFLGVVVTNRVPVRHRTHFRNTAALEQQRLD
jgi:hypothetical protein